MFSLESPHRGDSNEYTQHTIFNIKKENHPKSSKICSYRIFPWDSRTSSNKPSVFEPLKFYYIETEKFSVSRFFTICAINHRLNHKIRPCGTFVPKYILKSVSALLISISTITCFATLLSGRVNS